MMLSLDDMTVRLAGDRHANDDHYDDDDGQSDGHQQQFLSSNFRLNNPQKLYNRNVDQRIRDIETNTDVIAETTIAHNSRNVDQSKLIR